MSVALFRGATRLGLFILLLCSTTAVAQDFDTYLQEIRENNPAYLAAFQRWQAAHTAIDAANTLPDPTLGLGIFLNEVETRVGPQKQRLSLGQTIPWRGKRALRAQKAAAHANKLLAYLDETRLQLETEFKTHYADYFYLGRAISITKDHLQLLKDLEAVVTEKYETNAAKYNELIRIQIEVDALSDRLSTQKEAAAPLRVSLNAILGRPLHQAMPFPDALPSLNFTEDLSRASEYLAQDPVPALRRIDHQIELEKTNVQLAKKDLFPDFKFGLDWINTGEAISPDQPGSGDDALLVSVGINVPIWRKKYRARERSAALQIEASVHQRRDVQARLETQLKRAMFRWDDASRKLILYRDQIIPKAEESLSVLTSGFQTGEATYLDLIDAEKALLEFLLSLHQAQSNQMKALATIEGIVGKSLSTAKQED